MKLFWGRFLLGFLCLCTSTANFVGGFGQLDTAAGGQAELAFDDHDFPVGKSALDDHFFL
jgi:hypothetical protein